MIVLLSRIGQGCFGDVLGNADSGIPAKMA